MNLFVLRHGKAEPSSPDGSDSGRALTADGKTEMKHVARWMRSGDYRFDIIATSPLVRSRETAGIVAKSLGREDRIESWDELAPGGDPDSVCYRASQFGNEASVLIVGHEPDLSTLIGRIICGNGGSAAIVMAKGGLAKIRDFSFTSEPSGELQWLLTPKLMTEGL